MAEPNHQVPEALKRALANPRGQAQQAPPPSVDGYPRPPHIEAEINRDFATLFRSQLGHKVLAYLRSITIHSVLDINASNEQLRHKEGQRYLFGIIDQRIMRGIQEAEAAAKDNVVPPPEKPNG